MVDDIDNPVDDQVPGWHLALLLLAGFRDLVDETHQRLADEGHAGARPAHGFALQAIGPGATNADLATRLGVTKQAAAKTIASLEREGYVERAGDTADGRRVIVRPTTRGIEFLALSASAFEHAVTVWRDRVGTEAIDRLGSTLHQLDLPVGRFDLAAWSG
ncbi:MarR family winged helix-turn-helix transcriptional regulator [Flexivirga alba]|jgi:Transcriptional regulators|uniref:MarR family winged helix-turn-helix transcriptional regulator n=1 Tax=Flexivirga alba TaxID=702742 RepID=A0ABW2AGK3_9MICO